jgi:glycosyltransferase involved in cell wall biosynthesis
LDAVPRVLLCHQPSDGGVGRHVRDLAEGLRASGWEVLLCGPQPPRGCESIPHVRLDLGRAIDPRADAAAVVRLARIVRETRVDLVHAHSSKAGAVARLARAGAPRVPLVYTPHGYAFAGHFERSSQRRLYRLLERALAPLASRVVCVCEAEARLARSLGVRSRVRIVHNGVAAAGAGPVDARIAALAARGPVIGALTLLRPGKGIETLIAALPLVLAREPRAQLAICGGGPDGEPLRALAQRAGVGAAVHFLGEIDDAQQALRGFDVLAHPSWAESFPYVILEAMALGRAIVASDVGGVGEALLDGEDGLLVGARDERALAQALIELLEDRQRAARMGSSARLRAERLFSLDAMIERLTRVYDELVPSASGARRQRAAQGVRESFEKPVSR